LDCPRHVHVGLSQACPCWIVPGMSMFSTRNGLYEKARKQFKITDGIKLFTYSFYKQHRESVQAFFAQIYSEAEASKVGWVDE